jgi:hypothetical protein
MKRIFVGVIVLFLGLAAVIPGHAQSTATSLDRLAVDIWPDFDQPSVLVLLTGTFPAGTTYPATIVIPVPEEATIHAVARVDEVSGNMLTDIVYDDSATGQISLTASSPIFRIEYYVPYEADDTRRSYTFSWRSDLLVNELQVSVQQPVAAANLTTDPGGASVVTGNDGLRYSNFSLQALPAGQTYSLDISYEMPVSQLTVDLLQPAESPIPAAVDQTTQPAASGLALDWSLLLTIVVGGLAVVGVAVAAIWLSNRHTAPARSRKPRPARRPAPGGRVARSQSRATGQTNSGGQVRFCHQCGQPVEPGDRFCRECGTPLKRS